MPSFCDAEKHKILLELQFYDTSKLTTFQLTWGKKQNGSYHTVYVKQSYMFPAEREGGEKRKGGRTWQNQKLISEWEKNGVWTMRNVIIWIFLSYLLFLSIRHQSRSMYFLYVCTYMCVWICVCTDCQHQITVGCSFPWEWAATSLERGDYLIQCDDCWVHQWPTRTHNLPFPLSHVVFLPFCFTCLLFSPSFYTAVFVIPPSQWHAQSLGNQARSWKCCPCDKEDRNANIWAYK